jgi:pimeloyl-ACP methyl ester carboxylesterase
MDRPYRTDGCRLCGVDSPGAHDADRFYVDPATQSPEERATFAANLETLKLVAGDPYMHDPGLRQRLGAVRIPVLVLWGDSDGIFTPGYGHGYAASFPNATFELVQDAGHLPQLERPAATMALIDRFVAT